MNRQNKTAEVTKKKQWKNRNEFEIFRTQKLTRKKNQKSEKKY